MSDSIPDQETMATERITELTLQPGQIIRPALTKPTAIEIIERLYGLKVKSITEQNSYDDKNYKISVEDEWCNKHIEELWPHGYVFKVLNAMDSPKKHVDAEHAGEFILERNGINCPIPVLNIHGNDKSLEKIYSQDDDGNCNNNENRQYGVHMCRLMKFVSGKIFHSVPYTASLLYEAGVYTARIHQAWKDFDHPALHNHQTIWNLSCLPKLKEFVYAVRDNSYKQMIHEIIDAFENEVIPQCGQFKEGVIHGDINEQNFIVKEIQGQDSTDPGDRTHMIHGILDFGDNLVSYLMFDVAIAIMYLSVESKIVDPLLVGGHILAGYLTKCSLSDAELDALKICVAGRYAQSLVMGEYTYSIDPGNDYVLTTAKNGWPQLQKLWATPKDEIYAQWRQIIADYQTS